MRTGGYRRGLMLGTAFAALAMLAGCGGGGGSVASTPPPPVSPPPAPPPPPPPPPSGNFDTAEYRASNAVVQAGAITAYNAGATGSGITVGVIDSGISLSTSEFAGRIHPASADLAGSRGLGDEGGHGSAVSGVLLAAKDDVGFHGLAFNATLLVAKTDTPGSCATTDPEKGCSHNDNAIARGVDLAAANNARVINISLGGSPANNTLRAAIGRATAAGIVIVISAGNDSLADPDSLALIANDPIANNLVIIAGGLNTGSTELATFTNKAGSGASHYLGALAFRVRTINELGQSVVASGTSFSAPTIAGAVALLAQAFPTLSGAQIVDLLYKSANDLGDAGQDAQFGRGGLNITRAFAPQGGASLAGSLTPVTLDATGTLSTAMGDGGQTGSSAVILDGYGRAFDLQLGGFRRAPGSSRLAQGLSGGVHTRGASFGATAFSVSLAESGRGVEVERLMLAGADSERARALAGSVVTRLGPKTRFALGISSSGLALARGLEGTRSSDFLASRAAHSDWGFDARTGNGLALAQSVSGFTVSLAAETGEARLWDSVPAERFRAGWRRYSFNAVRAGAVRTLGPIRFGVAGSWLSERETVLGSRLGSFYTQGGAKSWFVDSSADWQAAKRLRLSAAFRQGWTRVGGGSLHSGTDTLHSQAWSIDAVRTGVISAGDLLALRVAQPLRITQGSLTLTLPSRYDYATRSVGYTSGEINFAPQGHELDVEALYTRHFGNAAMTGNVYWRRDPGNLASLPADVGLAVRFTLGL